MVKVLALQENSIVENAFIFFMSTYLREVTLLNYQNYIKNPQIIGYSALTVCCFGLKIK